MNPAIRRNLPSAAKIAASFCIALSALSIVLPHGLKDPTEADRVLFGMRPIVDAAFFLAFLTTIILVYAGRSEVKTRVILPWSGLAVLCFCAALVNLVARS